MSPPTQQGELLAAVDTGLGLTVTLVLLLQVQPLGEVMVTAILAVLAAPAVQVIELVP
jgi:hypothetical protein